jgi:hypothetical protein
MVDTLALGASAFGCEGSSPSLGTNFIIMTSLHEQEQSDLTLETHPPSTENGVEYINLGDFWPVKTTTNPLIQLRYKITITEEE